MTRSGATIRHVTARHRIHAVSCSSSWCFAAVMLVSLSLAAENSIPDLQILEPTVFHTNPWWHTRGALSPYCTSLHLSASSDPKKDTTTNDKKVQSAEAAFHKIMDQVPELAGAFLLPSPIDLGGGTESSVGDGADATLQPPETLPFGQLLPFLPTAPRSARALNLVPSLDDRMAPGFGSPGHRDPIIPIHRGRQSVPASNGAQQTCDLSSIVMEGNSFNPTSVADSLRSTDGDNAMRESKSGGEGAVGADEGRRGREEDEEYGLSMLECIPLSLRQELDLLPPQDATLAAAAVPSPAHYQAHAAPPPIASIGNPWSSPPLGHRREDDGWTRNEGREVGSHPEVGGWKDGKEGEGGGEQGGRGRGGKEARGQRGAGRKRGAGGGRRGSTA